MNRRDRGVVREMRVPLIAVAAVVVYAITGYLLFGHGLLESLHRTALVLTTVGFTPDKAASTGEELFTSSVAVFGVAAFLAALAFFTGALVEGRIGQASRRRRMDRRISGLKNHFIICAYGRVGRAVARELEAEGVPFVVVDILEELGEAMVRDGIVHVIGDPSNEAVLRHVGIDRARALVSAVDSDADNVYITLTARSLNPSVFIVARASEAAAADRLYRAGADRVVSPYVSSGRHMALLALRPRVVDYLEIAGRDAERVRLEELLVEQASPLVGKTVAQASGAATALVIRRAGGEIVGNPSRETTLNAGDLIVLLGDAGALSTAEGSGATKPRRRAAKA